MTAISRSARAMNDAPDDRALRLRFFSDLAATEIFLLLQNDARDQAVEPEIVAAGGEKYVLVFDSESRLVDFTSDVAAHVSMSGRGLVEMLAEADIGMGFNLGSAGIETLIDRQTVRWLHENLGRTGDHVMARATGFFPPGDLPHALLRTLEQRLAAAAGLADMAYLATATYADQSRQNLLAVVNVRNGAEAAFRQVVADLVRFGEEPVPIDLVFLEPASRHCARLERIALRIDLPVPQPVADVSTQTAPGMDPAKPPILK